MATAARLLTRFGIGALLLLIALIAYIFLTTPSLPDQTDAVIETAIYSELPGLVRGKTGIVSSGGYRVWYESTIPNAGYKGSILLFMGMAADALEWPLGFIDGLLAGGYQIIRFDYRGTGMSDWVADWRKKPYSLMDLVADAEAILDAIDVESVHLVGLSMGGMVAQEFAIKSPERTKSLAILMSSGHIEDPELPTTSKRAAFEVLKAGIKYGLLPGEENAIKLLLSARLILRGDAAYEIDIKSLSERVLYNVRKRNGYNPDAPQQHNAAAKNSGPRYDRLKALSIPVLIIHGVNDPLVPIAHGKKLAAAIPGSRYKWFENMGHDLPSYLLDQIAREIITNAERGQKGTHHGYAGNV